MTLYKAIEFESDICAHLSVHGGLYSVCEAAA